MSLTYNDGNEVSIGDLVKLNSGGPLMTVVAFCLDDLSVGVGWFAESDNFDAVYRTEDFPVTALKEM